MNEPTNDKIRDNPSFAKMQKDMMGMLAISKIVALLDRLGIRHDKISEAMKQMPDLAQQFEAMVIVPDRFNGHFSRLEIPT